MSMCLKNKLSLLAYTYWVRFKNIYIIIICNKRNVLQPDFFSNTQSRFSSSPVPCCFGKEGAKEFGHTDVL